MTEPGGMTYEKAQTFRKAIFALVEDKRHWKNAIHARVARDTPELRDAITDAVIHFTGSIPEFMPVADGSMIVSAKGYYATIGA